MNKELDNATLAGGCFWCLEAVYELVQGVTEVVSGYTGGMVPDPTYEEVCTGRTGHAEVVQLTFDPRVVTYGELLRIFFTIHDPTTRNRQGADVGTQYRSAIFHHSEAQRDDAQAIIQEMTNKEVWPRAIVTEVSALEVFYEAESDHQQYYRRYSNLPYCQVVIAPKVAKLRSQYLAMLKV
jgi:peptide-methionine (S)-S-oxide reductase